jgi:hypothetical protein
MITGVSRVFRRNLCRWTFRGVLLFCQAHDEGEQIHFLLVRFVTQGTGAALRREKNKLVLVGATVGHDGHRYQGRSRQLARGAQHQIKSVGSANSLSRYDFVRDSV